MVDFTKYLNRSTEAPTQRFRTFLQGVTFGFADEIEAGIRSIGAQSMMIWLLRLGVL